MQNVYEAPALTLIGEANDIVMGFSSGGDDLLHIESKLGNNIFG